MAVHDQSMEVHVDSIVVYGGLWWHMVVHGGPWTVHGGP